MDCCGYCCYDVPNLCHHDMSSTLVSCVCVSGSLQVLDHLLKTAASGVRAFSLLCILWFFSCLLLLSSTQGYIIYSSQLHTNDIQMSTHDIFDFFKLYFGNLGHKRFFISRCFHFLSFQLGTKRQI